MLNLEFDNTIFTNCIPWLLPEVFCLISLVLNFLLSFLAKRKAKIIKISNVLTFGAFIFGFLGLGSFLIYNLIISNDFNFAFLNGAFVLNKDILILKSLIVLFFLFFFLSRYAYNKKFRGFNLNLNLIILSISLIAGVFIQTNVFFISYILFEIMIFLAYQYSSCINLDREEVFAKNYILINLFSSVLFLFFYFTGFFIKNGTQAQIINILTIAALAVKIGFFPYFNYSACLKHKNNFSFVVLNFLFLPLMGCLLCNKLLEDINIQTSSFLPLAAGLLGFSVICFSLGALRSKNIINFLIQTTNTFYSFCLINQILFMGSANNQKMLFSYFYILFALYCLIEEIKIKNAGKKINLNLIKGFVYENYKLSNLIILALLFLVGIFPSLIMSCVHFSLREIYLYDKYIALLIFVFVFCDCLIFFQMLKIILAMYGVKLDVIKQKNYIKKGMNINYIIPILILITLFILGL